MCSRHPLSSFAYLFSFRVQDAERRITTPIYQMFHCHRRTLSIFAITFVVILISKPIIFGVAAFSIHVDSGGGGPSRSTSLSLSSSSSSSSPSPPKKEKMIKTFYRRVLPSTAISFSSSEGRAIFASAMASGGTYSFFSLIEQL